MYFTECAAGIFKHSFNYFSLQHSYALVHVLCTLVNHLRLAVDSIAIHEGSLLAPQQEDADDVPYDSEQALKILDLTLKLIKSISDHGGKEHIIHIINTCPDITVIVLFYLTTYHSNCFSSYNLLNSNLYFLIGMFVEMLGFGKL